MNQWDKYYWEPPEGSLREQYSSAQSKFPGGVRKVEVEDPKAEWAGCRNGDAPRKQARFRAHIWLYVTMMALLVMTWIKE
jgi:hypothetical protein